MTFDDPALRAENRLSLRFASHHPEQDCSDWEEAIGRQINLARRQLSDEANEDQICNQSPATVMTTYPNTEEADSGAIMHSGY